MPKTVEGKNSISKDFAVLYQKTLRFGAIAIL
jgi:hypothetical protein